MQTVVVNDEQVNEAASTKSRLSSLIERHPLASFFVLAYAISWLLWAPLVVSGDSSPSGPGFILLLLGSLVPSSVAILLVAVLHGRAGVRRLLHRLLIWRVGVGWWVAVALVSTLALGAVGLSVLLGGPSPDVTVAIPGAVALFVFFLFPGSAGGEEIGWRGFALPQLQAARSALRREPRPRCGVGGLAPAPVPVGHRHSPAQPFRALGRPHSRCLGHLHLDLQRHRRKPADGCPVSCGIQLAIGGLPRASGERRPGHSALPDLCRADGARGCSRGGCGGSGDSVPQPDQAGCRTVTRSSAAESTCR